MLLDIWNGTQYDVMDVYDSTIVASYKYIKGEQKIQYDIFEIEDLEEKRIKSRPTYPSDKFIINIADITKDKNIRYISIIFLLNKRFGVEAMLEDTKRDSMTSYFIK